ncbi:MAG TPA: tetratricopeptide repeat protein [Sphingomonas sp.]|nr:tetratricopeptide repeat protein [Sphingomonas sp.]
MRSFLVAALAAFGIVGSAAPALAQSQSQLGARVDRLESEMHAVQRKVFPGGAGLNYVQPQITPDQAPQDLGYGTPASSPLTDLTARVGSLEQQMSSMTNTLEETQHRLQLLQDDFANYKRVTDQRLATLEGGPGGLAGAGAAGGPKIDAPPPLNGPSPEDSGAVSTGSGSTATVEKPSTGDPAEDAYIYGYRLWAAKQYAAAEAQLKSVVAKYPDSRRASFAQNLLGRAYLDDGKPSLASIAFYDNYKKMPDGERAPDSLYYLAQALMQLKKPADACKVYSELSDVYGGKISPSMTADIAQGRRVAQCK